MIDHEKPSFELQVEALHPYLLRFARSQLRNDTWAEDAVSETMLAALEGRQSFLGRSSLKTWLVGILKFKVIDELRRHAREATVTQPDDDMDLEDLLFAADGHWREMPPDWGCGFAALNQRQFLEVFEACLDGLPPVQGRVFLMREWLEFESEQVCSELEISRTNLFVLMHRARLRLRECLQHRWFDDGHASIATTAESAA